MVLFGALDVSKMLDMNYAKIPGLYPSTLADLNFSQRIEFYS